MHVPYLVMKCFLSNVYFSHQESGHLTKSPKVSPRVQRSHQESKSLTKSPIVSPSATPCWWDSISPRVSPTWVCPGVSCVQSRFFPNFEPFKIHYFHSHLLASRGQDYFFFLISICFDIVFFPNSDKSNFDESKSLRIEIRKKSNVKTYWN